MNKRPLDIFRGEVEDHYNARTYTNYDRATITILMSWMDKLSKYEISFDEIKKSKDPAEFAKSIVRKMHDDLLNSNATNMAVANYNRYNTAYGKTYLVSKPAVSGKVPDIKRVIFSGDCTIVLWSDDTKTIVRVQDNEAFDPEKGLAMAISKKALGNNNKYYDVFKKWTKEEL